MINVPCVLVDDKEGHFLFGSLYHLQDLVIGSVFINLKLIKGGERNCAKAYTYMNEKERRTETAYPPKGSDTRRVFHLGIKHCISWYKTLEYYHT